MVVILNNSSFQLARCMLNFRDSGIKKLEPLCMAIINSYEKNLVYNFGNDSISKMNNSIYKKDWRILAYVTIV